MLVTISLMRRHISKIRPDQQPTQLDLALFSLLVDLLLVNAYTRELVSAARNQSLTSSVIAPRSAGEQLLASQAHLAHFVGRPSGVLCFFSITIHASNVRYTNRRATLSSKFSGIILTFFLTNPTYAFWTFGKSR